MVSVLLSYESACVLEGYFNIGFNLKDIRALILGTLSLLRILCVFASHVVFPCCVLFMGHCTCYCDFSSCLWLVQIISSCDSVREKTREIGMLL